MRSPFSSLTDAGTDFCPLGNHPLDKRVWEQYAPPPPEKKFYQKNEGLTTKEVYQQANYLRNRKKDFVYNGVYNQIKAYLTGENPVKPVNEVVKVALKRTGNSYKRTAMWALIKEMKRRLKEDGIDYQERSVSIRCYRIFCHLTNKVIRYRRLGGKKSIDQALSQAIKNSGYRIKKNDKTKLKKLIIHNLQKLGIDWETPSNKDPKKFPKCSRPSILEKNKYLKSNTATRASRIKSDWKLRNLTFALIKGRKKRFGFGRYWCSNDEDWVTLRSLHYDNCKVAFNERILFKPIYELLRLGAKVKDIVVEYGILLHRHHGLAVDTESTVWQPTGLVKELKERVLCKYLP